MDDDMRMILEEDGVSNVIDNAEVFRSATPLQPSGIDSQTELRRK